MAYRTSFAALIIPLVFAAMPGLSQAAPPTARSFATPEAAASALTDAMRHGDEAALGAVLGPGSAGLVHTGDRVSDEALWQRFLSAYDTKHSIMMDPLGRKVLIVGDNDWPLPIPIVQNNGQWRFDSRIGAQEIVDRRIGRNEIAAIRTVLAYVDAQKRYFALTKQKGSGEYAQRLVSTPGRHDGLYWPAAAGEPESPLQPLVDQAVEEGYPGADMAHDPLHYQGYYYRILTAQGDDAPGGAVNYLVNGRMIRGFAMIAWPVTYGVSGIMTFEVGPDGIVFQKDLEEATASLAMQTQLFEPDLSWARVDLIQQ
jgi:hypothetical protein